MKSKTSLFTMAVALGAALPSFAQSQNCATRDTVIERLAERYGESRQSIGMAPEGRVIEVFASEETGTWTITVTLPSGVTCLVASGEAYENVDEPLQPAGVRS